MKELILVRHREAEHLTKRIIGGWTDLLLTDKGRRQIKLTGKRLKELLDNESTKQELLQNIFDNY